MSAESHAANNFRMNVRSLLSTRDLTITQLAIDLGMSRPAMSRLLHGREDVTFTRGEKIAAYFGLDLHDLLKPPKKVRQSA